jgi:hypothetical protein
MGGVHQQGEWLTDLLFRRRGRFMRKLLEYISKVCGLIMDCSWQVYKAMVGMHQQDDWLTD